MTIKTRTQKFEVQSEKVHTVRYKPMDSGDLSSMMPYIPKTDLPTPIPLIITLTITWEE